MGIINKMLNFVGLENEIEEEVAKETVPKINFSSEKLSDKFKIPEKKNKNKNRLVEKLSDEYSNNEYQLVVMRIKSFEEAKQISDYLLENKSVVINLEDIDKDVAKRILDFLSGSVYTIFGDIQKISNAIFLLTPEDINVLDQSGGVTKF